MIKIRDYKADSPEWVMAKFFDCWKRRAWKQMADYIQLSWLDAMPDPSKMLKSHFNVKLLDVNFIQVNARTGVVTEFLIELDVSEKAVHKIRLICETAPMRPSPKGKWGVNPTSIVLKVKMIPKEKTTLPNALPKIKEEDISIEEKTEKTKKKRKRKPRKLKENE